MFILSKLAGVLTDPLTMMVLVFALGWGLAARGRFRRFGRGLMAAVGIVALVIATVPVEMPLLRWLEDRFPRPRTLPERVDGIVILGGGINPGVSQSRGLPTINSAVARLTEAIPLAQRYPEARILFTGGSGNLLDQRFKESTYAKEFLEQIGFDSTRILFEERSRNTYENALFSKEILQPQPGEIWLLITSASHMPRSVGCFRAQGWPVIAYPVDYRTLAGVDLDWRSLRFSLAQGVSGLSAVLHEALGLVSYYRLGWTDTLIPAP